MSTLRENAIDLIKQVPEDNLYNVVQIISGVNNLYGSGDKEKREAEFIRLRSFGQAHLILIMT